MSHTGNKVAHSSHWEDTMKPILVVSLWAMLFGCRTNESPEGQVDDLQITAQVKSKLASDVGVSSVTNISVNSTNGVVTLSGQARSIHHMSRPTPKRSPRMFPRWSA